MRYSVLIASIAFIISGCCGGGSMPDPPHGTPDDRSVYESGGYKSVTYTYYCLGGQYKSYTYIREDKCSDFTLDSKYTSDGICNDYGSDFSNLSPSKQRQYLLNKGQEIDTVHHHYLGSRGVITGP